MVCLAPVLCLTPVLYLAPVLFVADEPGAAVVAEDEVGLVDGEVSVIVVGAEGDLNARGEGGEDFGADVHESREVIPSREGDVRRAFGVGVGAWGWDWKRRLDGECRRTRQGKCRAKGGQSGCFLFVHDSFPEAGL